MMENRKQTRKIMEQIFDIGELFEKITEQPFKIKIGKSKWFNNENQEPNHIEKFNGDLYLCINENERFYIVDDFCILGSYVFCNIDDIMEQTRIDDKALLTISKAFVTITKAEMEENYKDKDKIKILNGLITYLNNVVRDLGEIESNE